MEFYHLRSFVAVAQSGNLTKAAVQLLTTPPSVSGHIKALEQELNTQLFNRLSSGMQLTPMGESLLTRAKLTLDSAHDMIDFAAQQQTELMGSFVIATNQSPKKLKLTELIANMQEHCPQVNLTVQASVSGKIIAGLRSEELSGGYIYGTIPDDLEGFCVVKQNIVTIAPRDMAISKPYTNLPWITMGNDCPFDNLLKQKLGNSIHSVVASADEMSRLALVKSGYGVSFIESDVAVAQHENQLQIIDDLAFSTELNFVVLKKHAHKVLYKAILQEIRVLWDIAL